MSGYISLNGLSTPQPKSDGVKEELVQIYHDRMLVNGSLRRHFFGVKKQATLAWDGLVPADYQFLMGLFTSGNTITYANSLSAYTGGSFAFVGLPMHSDDNYIPGTSLLRTLSVVIREA